jgi:hypothetical protein
VDGWVRVVIVNLVVAFHSTVVSPVAVPWTCMLAAEREATIPLAAIFGGWTVVVGAGLATLLVGVADVDPHAASSAPLSSALNTTRLGRRIPLLLSLF